MFPISSRCSSFSSTSSCTSLVEDAPPSYEICLAAPAPPAFETSRDSRRPSPSSAYMAQSPIYSSIFFASSSSSHSTGASPSSSSSGYLPASPLGPAHLADPSSPSLTTQLLCKLFPCSRLSKKMNNADKEGGSIIKELEEGRQKDSKAKAKNSKNLAERDALMNQEFGRLGL